MVSWALLWSFVIEGKLIDDIPAVKWHFFQSYARKEEPWVKNISEFNECKSRVTRATWSWTFPSSRSQWGFVVLSHVATHLTRDFGRSCRIWCLLGMSKLSPAECSCNTPVWKFLVCLGKPWLAGSGVKLKACRTGQPWCRMFGHKCIPLYFTICFKFKKGVRVWSYWCCKCIHLNSLLCAGYVCGRMYEISGSSIQQLTNFFPFVFQMLYPSHV